MFESSDLRRLEGEIQKGPVLASPPSPDPRADGTFNFLHVSLISIKQVLARHLGVKNIEYVFTDNVKQHWKLKNKIEYPRSYILFEGLNIERTINNRAARTGGYAAVKDAQNRTGNAVSVASVFPVKLQLSFHYFDNDESRLLKVLETLAIMAASASGAYQIRVQNTHLHQSRLEFDDNIQVPQLDLSLDMNPESAELVANFTVSTFIGSVYDVARNLNVTVDKNVGAANLDLAVVDAQGQRI